MKGLLILMIGGCIGWAVADAVKAQTLDRCDTEVLTCRVQLNQDREAYFRELAECQAP